jgi:outer membrane protein TolC
MQRSKRQTARLIPIGLMMAWASYASAQLSLSSAVDLALRNDPKVRMAQADVDKAKAALLEVKDAYVPSASINGGYGTSTGVPLGVPVVFSIASQSLLFNFSQQDNHRAATSALEAATLSLQESREKVTEDVVVTYVNLDNMQRQQETVAQEYGVATRLVIIVGDRLNAGQDTNIELLQAKHTAAQIRLDQLHTEDEVDTLEDHLARLIGLPGNQLTTISSSIPAMPPINVPMGDGSDTYGIRAAMANARSKQEIAFGAARYRFRPQVGFGANYSRISTSQTDYVEYYPGFKHASNNAASVGIQISVPLFDRGHEDRAHQAAAEAVRARYEAEDQRNQFLEGRFKLQHSMSELSARVELAQTSIDLAKAQLDATTAQLSAGGGDPNKPELTPKDEQNAHLQQSQRVIDLLDAQFQLQQAQVNLLRQTGQLDAWLKNELTPTSTTPTDLSVAPVKP